MIKKLCIICFTTIAIFSCNLDTEITTDDNKAPQEVVVNNKSKEMVFIHSLEDKLSKHFGEGMMNVEIFDSGANSDSDHVLYFIQITDENGSSYNVGANEDLEMINFIKNFSETEHEQILPELDTYIDIFHLYNHSFENQSYVEFTNILRDKVTQYFTSLDESFISYESTDTDLSYILSTFVLGIGVGDDAFSTY